MWDQDDRTQNKLTLFISIVNLVVVIYKCWGKWAVAKICIVVTCRLIYSQPWHLVCFDWIDWTIAYVMVPCLLDGVLKLQGSLGRLGSALTSVFHQPWRGSILIYVIIRFKSGCRLWHTMAKILLLPKKKRKKRSIAVVQSGHACHPDGAEDYVYDNWRTQARCK